MLCGDGDTRSLAQEGDHSNPFALERKYFNLTPARTQYVEIAVGIDGEIRRIKQPVRILADPCDLAYHMQILVVYEDAVVQAVEQENIVRSLCGCTGRSNVIAQLQLDGRHGCAVTRHTRKRKARTQK